MRVAVVGAGMVGLVTLYTIEKRRLEFCGDLEVVAFERGKQVGGEWIFSEGPDVFDDQHAPSTSSIYQGLQSNFPYPIMQLHPDFPWPNETNTYATQQEVLAYIQSISDRIKLSSCIQFQKAVSKIRRDQGRVSFDVKDLGDGSVKAETFDFVFLCTGQFNLPYIPSDVDTSQFNGLKLHYHDLKDPARLSGKRVLVVGTSVAAMDMVSVLPSAGVQEVYFSWNRNKPVWFKKEELEPLNLKLKPKFVRAIGSTVFFADDTSADVDVILYCTGFRQTHPLVPELQLDFNAHPYLFPAYKHIVHPSCPNLFFIGKSAAFFVMSMRLEAEFACAAMYGRIALPSEEEMHVEISRFHAKWLARLAANSDEQTARTVIRFEIQLELLDEMAALAKCQPIDAYSRELSFATLRCRRSDILNYRRYRLVDRKDVDGSSGNNVFYPPEENKSGTKPSETAKTENHSLQGVLNVTHHPIKSAE